MVKKILFFLFFIIPFLLGSIGYYLEGVDLTDALYGAFALYAINPVLDEKNILVEMTRWLAPLTLASGVILAIRELGLRFRNFFAVLDKNAVTIYSDSIYGEMLKNNIRHSLLVGNDTVYHNKSSVIMFSDDRDTLQFYEKNKHKLVGQVIYMKLDNFNPHYIRSDNVRYFNIEELIAREYWKTRDLLGYYSSGKMDLRIALIGSDGLCERMLSSALLNNIYSLGQHIEYHVWNGSDLYENLHKDLRTMNDDEVIFHRTSITEDIMMLKDMDRVIIADEVGYDLLSAIFEICTGNEIDCFSSDGCLSNSIYGIYSRKKNKEGEEESNAVITIEPNITLFGNYENVLTDTNIITDKLFELAMKLNFEYTKAYGQNDGKEDTDIKTEWEKLDGFTKMSNISSADYHEIRLLIMKADDSYEINDRVAELEHIRWCRFHSLNHWKHGKTVDGRKDPEKHLHPLLVPFSELSREDKDRSAASVKFLLDIKK